MIGPMFAVKMVNNKVVDNLISVGVLEPGVPQPTSEFVLRAPNPGW